ncbi:MAG: MFS transporter [Clostridia bacterium]|nr:MFS transporter [Clostridia bacterium]
MNEQASVCSPFAARGYKRSRGAYTAECAFEYFIALLVAEPFLTKLLLEIGLDDPTIAIIQSLISVAFLFQLAAVFVVQRITNVKRVAATVHLIAQLLFTSLYLVPFLPFEAEHKKVIVIACFLLGYFGNYLVTSVIFRWGNSYVDPNKRARFAATKEMISLLTGVIVTFAMSRMIDHFETQSDLRMGFILTACIMTVICGIDFLCLMLMKNRVSEPPKKQDITPLWQVAKILFTNRGFVSVVIANSLWQVAHYLLLGSMGTYKQNELAMTVGTVQLINIVGQMGRFSMTRPIALYTSKRTYADGMMLGLSIAAVSFLLNAFTSPKLWWLVIVYTLINNFAMAGTGQNSLNIVYNYVEEKYFVQASAIKNSICGVVGFLAALIGGRILGTVQANGNMVLGMTIYGQQILSALSFIFAIIAIIYIRTVLKKQKVIAK